MYAAGGVVLELGLVAAGVVVVLAAIWIAARSRTPRRPDAPAAPPPARPATRRVAGPERRGLVRAPVARPVVVRRPTGEQRTFALDLSTGGVLVAGPSDLMVGELIELQMDLDGPVRARAEVVRDAPNGMKGLRFAALGDADRDRLERFVRSSAPQPA
jgi:hypothetical protein